MDKNSLKSEISKVLADLQKENIQVEPSAANQYNLNFYKVLDVFDKELVHSRFIAFLLNRKKSYMNSFIEILSSKDPRVIPGFEWKKAKLEKKIKMGRLDIFIENRDSKHHIIIENKLYAIDQDKQIERYRKEEKYRIL